LVRFQTLDLVSGLRVIRINQISKSEWNSNWKR